MVGAVIAFLSPVLGSLLKRTFDSAADQAGAEAARRMWARMEPELQATQEGAGALRRAAQRPDDPRALGALELQIEDLLTRNPVVARDVGQILNQVTHDDRVTIAGDVRADRGGYAAGRDQYISQSHLHDASGLAALRQTEGTARTVLVFALTLAFSGFGVFMFGILSFMGSSDGTGMLPWMPIGFGLMFVGIVAGNMAMVFSRPGRHRH